MLSTNLLIALIKIFISDKCTANYIIKFISEKVNTQTKNLHDTKK